MSEVNVSDGIRKMYEKVALRYDLFNRVVTFGLDGGWRRRAAVLVPARRGMTVLDVCAGTGDMTREVASKLGDGARVLALDFSFQMLSICRDKLSETPANVSLALGRGERMPVSSGDVDVACCAFALRNLESVMDGFLTELLRVLRPGGRAVLLETGRPTAPILRQAYMFYLKKVVPLEGRLITGDGPAYRYLVDSVLRFSTPDEFCRRLEATGFRRASYQRLSWGIATIYTAYKAGEQGGDEEVDFCE
jgi:demethylmenaquinone methyltransferase/2-methoxy-6-polyprenyl-1,4-benzoquinol methylase